MYKYYITYQYGLKPYGVGRDFQIVATQIKMGVPINTPEGISMAITLLQKEAFNEHIVILFMFEIKD